MFQVFVHIDRASQFTSTCFAAGAGRPNKIKQAELSIPPISTFMSLALNSNPSAMLGSIFGRTPPLDWD
ncbi:MAG: hypothetical protein NTW86_09480 [Candidatus Sumerlaeota bacterium]|nr:hypothetical protein [Candidatus Sumerlaeota bacterium]